ncbi:MAG: DUF1648 domain-containing protein [Acidobacteriaceae bacterium]
MGDHLGRWYWVASAVPISGSLYYLILLAGSFRRLPDEVPVHFGLDGSADGWLNRYAWAVLSLAIVSSIPLLVFTTRPSLDGRVWTIATLMYWGACGLVVGVCVEIVHAAAEKHKFAVWRLLVWLLLVPAIAAPLTIALKPWWLGMAHR